MDEFSLIHQYFSPLASHVPGAYGLKNDGAAINVPKNTKLVVTKDALVENVHFMPNTSPFLLAQKLLRVNLSDLASMGASPLHYMIALILPHNTPTTWYKDFAAGLNHDQNLFNCSLIGGDSCIHDGNIILSLTTWGYLSKTEKILERKGAVVGDRIYVTGTLGNAAFGLYVLKNTIPFLSKESKSFLINHYHIPQPRMKIAQNLGHYASCAMDISDGLMQDLTHICKASSVGANIHYNRLPFSPAVKEAISQEVKVTLLPCYGGDDYELLCVIPQDKEAAFLQHAQNCATEVTYIGDIVEEQKVTLYDVQNNAVTLPRYGYKHS